MGTVWKVLIQYFCCAVATILLTRADQNNDTSICDVYDEHCQFYNEEVDITNDTCKHYNASLLYFNCTNRCLLKYEHVSITYSCKGPISYDCNFENVSCNWSNLSEWKLASDLNWGNKPFVTDATIGTARGDYICISSNSNANQERATLRSRYIASTNRKCLTFSYQMKYKGSGSALLTVYQEKENKEQLFSYVLNNGTTDWFKVYVQLQLYEVYSLVFDGMVRNADIALDDISIFEGRCSENINRVCNFEQQKCYWITNSSYGTLSWIHGSVLDFNPKIFDHTTNTELGHCMYIRTHWNPGNGSARIQTTTSNTSKCFSFWYYITGNFIEFNVYLEMEQSQWKHISLINITQDKIWHHYSETIVANGTYWMILRVDFPGYNERLVAVDEVSFTDGPCPGDQKFSHECLIVNRQFEVKECLANDLEYSSLRIDLTGVNGFQTFNVNRIENVCKQTYGTRQCRFIPSTFLIDSHKCFIFNNTPHFLINHSCSEALLSTKSYTVSTPTESAATGSPIVPTTESAATGSPIVQTTESAVTGIIVGVVVGMGFIVSLVTLLLCFIRRSNSIRKKPGSLTNTVVLNDYTGHQSVALPTLPVFIPNNDDYTEIQTNNDNQHVNSAQTTSINSSGQNYAHLGQVKKSSDNKAGNSLHDYIYFAEADAASTHAVINCSSVNVLNEKDHMNNEYAVIDPNNDFSSGIDRHLTSATSPQGNYAILDPNETGFFRSEGNNDFTTEYSFAVPTNYNKGVSDLQDPYRVSENGTYNSTNQVCHKEGDTNIYSHAVENVYDTSYHDRPIVEDDGNYDHFFGDENDDTYNITKRG